MGVSRQSPEPLAVGAHDAVRMCGVSRATWYRLMSSGRVPQAVRLGSRIVWPVDDLRDWVNAGCPARDRWAAVKGGHGQ